MEGGVSEASKMLVRPWRGGVLWNERAATAAAGAAVRGIAERTGARRVVSVRRSMVVLWRER